MSDLSSLSPAVQLVHHDDHTLTGLEDDVIIINTARVCVAMTTYTTNSTMMPMCCVMRFALSIHKGTGKNGAPRASRAETVNI